MIFLCLPLTSGNKGGGLDLHMFTTTVACWYFSVKSSSVVVLCKQTRETETSCDRLSYQ